MGRRTRDGVDIFGQQKEKRKERGGGIEVAAVRQRRTCPFDVCCLLYCVCVYVCVCMNA